MGFKYLSKYVLPTKIVTSVVPPPPLPVPPVPPPSNKVIWRGDVEEDSDL